MLEATLQSCISVSAPDISELLLGLYRLTNLLLIGTLFDFIDLQMLLTGNLFDLSMLHTGMLKKLNQVSEGMLQSLVFLIASRQPARGLLSIWR